MRINTELLRVTFIGLALVAFVTNGNAQRRVKHLKKHNVVHQKKAKIVTNKKVNNDFQNKTLKVLKRTNYVILDARKAVLKNKVYTGGLSKAIHHQKLAKKLMHQNNNIKAMQHSRIAREYAFKSLKANKGRIDNDYKFTKEEYALMGANDSNDELGKELKENTLGIVLKDENITDKDMTDLEILSTDPAEYENK